MGGNGNENVNNFDREGSGQAEMENNCEVFVKFAKQEVWVKWENWNGIYYQCVEQLQCPVIVEMYERVRVPDGKQISQCVLLRVHKTTIQTLRPYLHGTVKS